MSDEERLRLACINAGKPYAIGGRFIQVNDVDTLLLINLYKPPVGDLGVILYQIQEEFYNHSAAYVGQKSLVFDIQWE